MSKLGFQTSPSQCILEAASTLDSCMKLWPKKMFGTASAEAAQEALHIAMTNEPLVVFFRFHIADACNCNFSLFYYQ